MTFLSLPASRKFKVVSASDRFIYAPQISSVTQLISKIGDVSVEHVLQKSYARVKQRAPCSSNKRTKYARGLFANSLCSRTETTMCVILFKEWNNCCSEIYVQTRFPSNSGI